MEPEIVEPRSGGLNFDFRAFLAWLKRWKVVVGGVAVLAVGYAGVTGMKEKPIFGAEARLLMTSTDSTPTSLTDIIAPGDNSEDINLLRGIFESRTTRKMIAEKAGLKYDDIKKKLTVLPDPQTKTFLIQARKFTTEKNLKVVQAAIEVLEARSVELQIGPAGKQASIMQESLNTREKELRTAEDSLAAFIKTMVSGPDASATLAQWREIELEYGAAVKALESAEDRVRSSANNGLDLPSFLPGTEDLRKTIIDRRLTLATLKQSLGQGNPQVVKATRDLKIAEDTLNAEVQKYIRSTVNNVDPVTAELAGRKTVLEWQLAEAKKRANLAPDEAKNFARLTREVGTLTAVVNQLRTQFETVKIQADTERLTWTVLDEPEQRDEQENSLPMKIIKFGLGGLVAGMVLAWLLGATLMRPARPRSV